MPLYPQQNADSGMNPNANNAGPQIPFEQSNPQDQSNGMFSFMDADFGPGPTGIPISQIPNPQEYQEQTQQTQGQPQTQPNNIDPNEFVRASHWQSQYDRQRNETDRFQRENAELKQRLEAIEKAQQVPQQQPEEFKIPDAPQEPQKPYNFNYQEAQTDPNSPSAKYLAEHDSWQRDIIKYNTLVSQYALERQNEIAKQFEERLTKTTQQQQAEMQQQQQIQQIVSQVQQQFGYTQADAMDFVKTIADDKFVTLERLVALYQIHKQQLQQAQQGIPYTQGVPQGQHQPNQPQQVPYNPYAGLPQYPYDGRGNGPYNPQYPYIPENDQLRRSQSYPPFVGNTPGMNTGNMDPGQQFMDAILGSKQKISY